MELKQKDGFQNETIMNFVVESSPVTHNENKKELVIPDYR